MKKLILFINFLILISCHSQKKNTMTLYLDDKMETLDTSLFGNINQLESFSKKTDSGYIQIMRNQTNISYQFTPNDSLYKIVKVYHLNHMIYNKGITLNLPWTTFPLGIWYEFDKDGKLIKKTDYDEPYKFTFEEVLAFCKAENIKLSKGPVLQSTGYHTTIRRRIEKEKPIWEIQWKKKPDVLETIILDGTSGKVLSKRESQYVNN